MLYQKKILLIFLSHCFFSFTLLEGAAAAAAATTSVSREATVQQALDALYGHFAGNSARVDLVVNHILDYYQPRVIRFELRPCILTIITDGKPAQEYPIKVEPYSLFVPPSYCWDSNGRLTLKVGVFQMHLWTTLTISIDQDGNVTVCEGTMLLKSPSVFEKPIAHHVCRDPQADRCSVRCCEAQLLDLAMGFDAAKPQSYGSRITGSTYDIQEAATARALLQEFKRRIALSAAAASSSSSARSVPESSGSASATAAILPPEAPAATASAAAMQGPAVGP